jgi:hypothetical protein
MEDATHAEIQKILNQTVDIVLERVREKARLFFNSEIASTGNGTASPFSKMLFPQIKLASLVERSYSASIGTAFNYIGRALVRNAYGDGDIEHISRGRLPITVANAIEEIVTRYRGVNHTSPDTIAELSQLDRLLALATGDDELVERTVKSDLHFHHPTGVEYFVEIKTPMPNYDTCRAVKIRILTVHALRSGADVHALVAFPFNPNGVLGEYAWPPARYFLDPKVDWAVAGQPMMGASFWNFLGNDPTTFGTLLEICDEVFRARNRDVMGVLNSVTFGSESV